MGVHCADASGFVAIDEDLRVLSSPGNVFCVGDMASSVKHPRPKAGVYAVRQGPPLADNIRRSPPIAPITLFMLLGKGMRCLAKAHEPHRTCTYSPLIVKVSVLMICPE